ncbi:MAG: Flp family type IVb pilin [Planctomycetes bacterium]|nr:Flp family type IVb pilin [Planctomycetota bacterium]
MAILTSLNCRWGRRERGQALTEYAIVLAACVVALLGVLGAYLTATVGYYEDIMCRLTLPIP